MFIQNFLSHDNHKSKQQLNIQVVSPREANFKQLTPTTLGAYVIEKSGKKKPNMPKFRRVIYESKQQKLNMKRRELIKLTDKMLKSLQKVKIDISMMQDLEELRQQEEKLKQLLSLLEGKLTFQNLFNDYKQLMITAQIENPHFENDQIMQSIQEKIQKHFDIIENKQMHPRKIDKQEIKRRLQSPKLSQYIVQQNLNENLYQENENKDLFKYNKFTGQIQKKDSKYQIQKRDFNVVMAQSTYLNDKQIQNRDNLKKKITINNGKQTNSKQNSQIFLEKYKK